jgi:hypothetical protein
LPAQIVDPRSLHVVKREPKASMAFVTRVVFSDDDARVLAVGGDANAFVLELRAHGGGGGGGGCVPLCCVAGWEPLPLVGSRRCRSRGRLLLNAGRQLLI